MKAFALALLSLAGGPRAEPLRVVATLPNLAYLAEEIGGDRVSVFSLTTPAQDPHFLEPKPSYLVRLRDADVFLVGGLDLEVGWLSPLTLGARNPRIVRGGSGFVDCSAGISVIEVPAVPSRAEGDVHPYGNPHYLTDPLNARIVARTIASTLARASPADASHFDRRRGAFERRLEEALFGKDLVDLVGGDKLVRLAEAGELEAFLARKEAGDRTLGERLGGWIGRLRALRGAKIVTYHRDWSYLVRRFGLEVVDWVEPKPGIPPSARHLAELVREIPAERVRAIVTRPYNETRSTEFLAEKTGARVLLLPNECGDPESRDYFALFDRIVEALVQSLS